MSIFKDLINQQQQIDKPGTITPQAEAEAKLAQQGGGLLPKVQQSAPTRTSSGGAGDRALQRSVLDLVGESTGQYIPDNAGGREGGDSIFIAKALRRAEATKTNAETDLIKQTTAQGKETFANDTQDRLEKRAIETGLRDSVTNGGYTGGIEFLKTVDPKQAMIFEKLKLGLDRDIMENDSFKMAHSNDKLKAMTEGYAILGNMGMAILQAKPEDRANMYQHVLPMVKQVNPNADETLTPKMVGMFGLAQFQAVDANKIAAGPVQQTASNTQISKLHARADALIKAGATVDSNPELKDTLAAIDGEKAKSQQYTDQAKITEWNLKHKDIQEQKDAQQAKAKTYQLMHSVQGDYDREVKPQVELNMAIMQMDAALKLLSKDPKNPVAQQQLIYASAKTMGDKRVSDMDQKIWSGTDSNLIQSYKNLKNWTSSGGKEFLTPNEIGNYRAVVETLKQTSGEKVRNQNHHYMDLTKGLGIDIKYANPAPPEALSILKSNPSPVRIKQFEATFGYVPNLGKEDDGQ